MNQRGRRYLQRSLVVFLAICIAGSRSNCSTTPATLTCAAINDSVFRGTCATLTNSCADLAWRAGDDWGFDNPPSGVTINTTISTTVPSPSTTVDRQICVDATAALMANQPFTFTYARAGEWGASTLYLTTGVALTVAAAANPTLINPNDTVQLAATASGGVPPYTYHWGPGTAFVPSPDVSNPTTTLSTTSDLVVVVTDSALNVATATVRVSVTFALTVVSAFPLTTNPGQVSQLSAFVTGGIPTYTYSWTPVSSLDDPTRVNPVASPVVTTTYQVTATDSARAMVSGGVTVTVNLLLVATANPASITTGGVSQLNAAVSGGTPPYKYLWSPATGLTGGTDIPNPTASPSTTTTYTVQVADSAIPAATAMGTARVDVSGPTGPIASFTITRVDANIVTCDGSASTSDVGIAEYCFQIWTPPFDPTQPFTLPPTGVSGCRTVANFGSGAAKRSFATTPGDTIRMRLTDVNGFTAFTTRISP